MSGLFGASPNDYYTGQQFLSDAKPYTQAQSYSNFDMGSFGGGMGNNYTQLVNQQLSGQLSQSQQNSINNQFQQGMGKINDQGYGMPMGALAGLQTQEAGQVAISAGQLGQQNIAQGQSAAMNYLGLGSQNNQYQNQYNMQNTQMQNSYNQGFNQQMGNLNENAYNQANSNTGIFGGLLGSATNWGLNQLFPQNNQNQSQNGFQYGGYQNPQSQQYGPTVNNGYNYLGQ